MRSKRKKNPYKRGPERDVQKRLQANQLLDSGLANKKRLPPKTKAINDRGVGVGRTMTELILCAHPPGTRELYGHETVWDENSG